MKTKLLAFFLVSLSLISFQSFAQKTAKKAETNKYVLVTTEFGTMKIKLYNETPKHRDNFIKLVQENFYDGLLFHRIIEGFMIQGGDPESKNAPQNKVLGSGDLGYTVPAEFVSGIYHKKGALAAARKGDDVNPSQASSASQFYIVQGKKYTNDELNMLLQRGVKISPEQRKIYTSVGGTPFLDKAYTVFGEVVEGLDVIDKIAAVQKDRNDRPIKDIKMDIKVVEK